MKIAKKKKSDERTEEIQKNKTKWNVIIPEMRFNLSLGEEKSKKVGQGKVSACFYAKRKLLT